MVEFVQQRIENCKVNFVNWYVYVYRIEEYEVEDLVYFVEGNVLFEGLGE